MNGIIERLTEDMTLRLIEEKPEQPFTLRELFGEELTTAESFSWRQHDLTRSLWERDQQFGQQCVSLGIR